MKTYFLQTTLDPHCMNCRAEWNSEFVDEHMSRSFRLGPLADHRRNVLLDREKSKLPAAMEAVDREKRRRVVADQARGVQERVKKLRKELDDATQLHRELLNTIYAIDHGAAFADDLPKQRSFIRGCPAEGCRGFLSPDWKCQLCDVKVCSKCHACVEGEHTCRAEDVATAELLAKDSKPCPVCAAIISKVDGCDQMWCTQCKSAFSWRTGCIERGPVHNPEYFRWMRENGHELPRQPGDVAAGGRCNELPNSLRLTRTLQANGLLTAGHCALLSSLRHLIHTQHVTLHEMRQKLIRGGRPLQAHMPGNPPEDDPDLDLRVMYLLNELDEGQWKAVLLKREKIREKLRAGVQLLDMLVTVAAEIMNKYHEISTREKYDDVMKELEGLRLYYNDQRVRICKRFDSENFLEAISETWNEIKL